MAQKRRLRITRFLHYKVILLALAITAGDPLGGCTQRKPVSPQEISRVLELVDRGTAFLRKGDLDHAEAAYRIALETVPHAAAIDGVGCIALSRGDTDRAEAFFKQALLIDPNYSRAEAHLGFLRDLSGYRDEALLLYRRALTADPQDAFTRNNLVAALTAGPATVASGTAASRDEVRPDTLRVELIKAALISNHPTIERNLNRLQHSRLERSRGK